MHDQKHTFTAARMHAEGTVTIVDYTLAAPIAATQTLTMTGAITAGVHAVGTITSDATAPDDGDTVTIGAKTYTFKTTLTGAANEVLIGASAAAALDNLKSAVNASAGAGTTYGTGTTANASVVATTNTDTTQLFVNRTVGTAGNSVATTETSAHLSFGGATLAGGVAGETVTIDGRVYTFVQELSETSGAAAVVDQVLRGADTAAALDNLKSALNASAGAGTTYGTGTTAHASVNATTNTDTTQVIAADTAGAAGNAIAVSETLTNGSWGAATLAGGQTPLTINFNGTALVAGTDFTAATSNDATATSLASAIDGISGVNAAAVAAVVTIKNDAVGTAGNAKTLTTSNTSAATVSGATLTGGAAALYTDAFDLPNEDDSYEATVVVSALTGGSPTADFTPEGSDDGGTTYIQSESEAEAGLAFTQFTAAGNDKQYVKLAAPRNRLKLVLGGTSPVLTGTVYFRSRND